VRRPWMKRPDVVGMVGMLCLTGAWIVAGMPTPRLARSQPAPVSVQIGHAGWAPAGMLHDARAHHTATLLPDGRVLVVGGEGDSGTQADTFPTLPSAEIYDPRRGTWTRTGALHDARQYHTATLLHDGRVLVVGGSRGTVGATAGNVYLASAELYDPVTGIWTRTGWLHDARSGATATLLADGDVLVAGGEGQSVRGQGSLVTAELYDPQRGTWAETGHLNNARSGATATLLRGGRVMVVGGFDSSGHELSTAEFYDPRYGTWTRAASLHDARALHTATLLTNGDVLVAGGRHVAVVVRTVHVYRQGHVIIVHAHRRVLVTLASVEIYDTLHGVWLVAASLRHRRFSHTANLLPDGRVLVAGEGRL